MSMAAILDFPTVLPTFLLLVELVLALPLLYLLMLSIGAIVSAPGARRLSAELASTPAANVPASTFAIVVPAYNEELLIGATLASLRRLDYPADRYTVHVIADNCTDRTAQIARADGANVLERTDAARRGKGYALAWALDQPVVSSSRHDAVIIVDADTIVDPQLLKAFARRLAEGGEALQAQYAVLNPSDSATAALRWLALSLVNYVRPLGRNRFGGSSTLTGNGMCLSRELLSRHPWRAYGLAEDYQYYLTVVSSGDVVQFVPEARVSSAMPVTVRQLRSQDIRWEALDPDSSGWQRRVAWGLLVDGIRQGDWARLDALAELMTPPLSVLAGGTGLLLVASTAFWTVFGAWLPFSLATLLGAALLLYVGSAFWLLRPPREVYRALTQAPTYILRKLWVYFVLRRRRKYTHTWVRTSRTAASSAREEGMPL